MPDIEALAAENERLKALSDLSVRRMAEMAEPGFIGAFGARDIAVARALAAESKLASVEAETREKCAKIAARAGCGDPKCGGCYGNQIAAAIRAGEK